MKILKTLLAAFALTAAISAAAESWDEIRTSGRYFFGVGRGATEAEADAAALADLTSQIATSVSADFRQLDDISNRNGNLDHNSRILNCVRTYSNATLTNTVKWVDGREPNITVRRHMLRSELSRIYESRITKARGMIDIADECLEARKVGLALQYYYWAYSLLRSIQYPAEVKDARGHSLVDLLPVKIDDILSDITVRCVGRDGSFIDLAFDYKGRPVSSMEFTYSDGRIPCEGLVKDGRGMMEMIPGYSADIYHINIEYQYLNQARGDAEMEAVLGVVTPKPFPRSAINVEGCRDTGPTQATTLPVQTPAADSRVNAPATPAANPQFTSGARLVAPNAAQTAAIEGIVRAISTRNYSAAAQYFTPDGLEMFNRLTSYGKARIIDGSQIQYFQGTGHTTVARGLRMSFTFTGRRKKTFVEDVSFTFSHKDKIESVAFGLGKDTQDGIFNRRCAWTPEVREIIVSFMENYKTAYSLERLDYISSIIDDNAVLITGTVIRRPSAQALDNGGRRFSDRGNDIIRYNRFSKAQFINHLKESFNKNDFINLRFTQNEVQWLDKFRDRTLFAINIRQEYNSTTYSDDGYLFLLVDMTKVDEPSIKVRTWQPNEVELDKLYNAGDFFND